MLGLPQGAALMAGPIWLGAQPHTLASVLLAEEFNSPLGKSIVDFRQVAIVRLTPARFVVFYCAQSQAGGVCEICLRPRQKRTRGFALIGSKHMLSPLDYLLLHNPLRRPLGL